MSVLADATVEVSHKGDVSSHSLDTAVSKVMHVADRCREPVRHIEVRLTVETAPARERPAIAEATVDVQGRPVRAHVAASVIDEAIDLLVEKLRRRIQRHEERRHRLPDRHRNGDSGPGEWRHGDMPNHRPEYLDLPYDEREVRRQKTFATAPMTVEEALFDLDQLGHHFYLFVDESSGADCVVRHTDDDVVELVSAAEVDLDNSQGVDLRVVVPPRHELITAKEHLEASGARHVVFQSAETDRSQVLYRRYDGHYGLVTLA